MHVILQVEYSLHLTTALHLKVSFRTLFNNIYIGNLIAKLIAWLFNNKLPFKAYTEIKAFLLLTHLTDHILLQ